MHMVIILRRLSVLAALMFWQGGFTFYAAVVVPLAQEQLGHRRQGFITREVAHYLNISGIVALTVFAWDLKTMRGSLTRLRQLRWATWFAMSLTLASLFVLYRQMDALLAVDDRGQHITSLESFYFLHRWYLWTITGQWVCAVGFGILSLWIWRAEDCGEKKGPETQKS